MEFKQSVNYVNYVETQFQNIQVLYPLLVVHRKGVVGRIKSTRLNCKNRLRELATIYYQCIVSSVHSSHHPSQINKLLIFFDFQYHLKLATKSIITMSVRHPNMMRLRTKLTPTQHVCYTQSAFHLYLHHRHCSRS